MSYYNKSEKRPGNAQLLIARVGLTIIEMMIVVAIIAVLVSIAVPTYAKMRRDAKAVACRANQKQIESAIDQWSFEYDVDEGTDLTLREEEIFTFLIGGKPTCPSGGNYELTDLGDNPQIVCSSGVEGHEYQ